VIVFGRREAAVSAIGRPTRRPQLNPWYVVLTKKMHVAIRGTFLLLIASSACDRGRVADIEASHPKYKPGQVWTYKTRTGEDGSRVTILRVDKHPVTGEYIVHIGVNGIAIRSPTTPGGVARTISHLPFAEKAVADSLVRVERTGPVPDFREGYQMWRSGFEQNKAGAWAVPIVGAISAMESALGKSE
jgi:hypothetical protein